MKKAPIKKKKKNMSKKLILKKNIFGLEILVVGVWIGAVGYSFYWYYKNPEIARKHWNFFKNLFWSNQDKPKKDPKPKKEPKKGTVTPQQIITDIEKNILSRATISVSIKLGHAQEWQLRLAILEFMKNPYVFEDGKVIFNETALQNVRVAFVTLQLLLKETNKHCDTVAELLSEDSNLTTNYQAFLNSDRPTIEVEFKDYPVLLIKISEVFSDCCKKLEIPKRLDLPKYNPDNFFYNYDTSTHTVSAPISQQQPIIFQNVLKKLCDSKTQVPTQAVSASNALANVFDTFPVIFSFFFA